MTEPFYMQQMAPKRNRRTTAILVGATVIAVAAGLGGAVYALTDHWSPAAPAAAVATTSPPATAAASPAPNPTPAATAGKLGKVVPVSLGGDTYTVAALRYAQEKVVYDTGPETYGAVEARFCVAKANGRPIEISSAPWSLLYPEAVVTEQASGSFDHAPEYPSHMTGGRPVQPGKCLRGWIHFSLPDGKKPSGVEYAAEVEAGEFVFTWML